MKNITVNSFKAAVKNNGPVQQKEAKQSMFKQGYAKTCEFGAKAKEGIRGVLPVTTRRFEDVIDQVDTAIGNLDVRQSRSEVRIEQLYGYMGAKMASDADVDRVLAEREAALKEQKEQEAVKEEPAVEQPATEDVQRTETMVFGSEEEVTEVMAEETTSRQFVDPELEEATEQDIEEEEEEKAQMRGDFDEE